ncbi:HD domain-containing protein [Gorgonomyces haynaldii]|nr:HD domain-containing protein [Gorgonomyces haynaldii]
MAETLEFLTTVSNLKKTKRTGWVNHGIHMPESISDHMHRMAIIAFLIQDTSLNRDKLIKMTIVHDLAEAVVGDITPHQGVSKEDKFKMEHDAMLQFVEQLGKSKQAQEILDLWLEYEHAQTPEALICKDIDKFEMILQAYEYEQSDNKQLDSFFESTQGKFKHPEIRHLVEALYQKRSHKIA